MKFLRWLSVLLLFAVGNAAAAETISHGRFEQLKIYRPHGDARQTVLFFSGERGWEPELESIAHARVGGANIVSVPGDNDGAGDFHTWEPQFAAAYQKLVAQAPAPPKVSASELRDLPLIEVPATGTGDTLALLISGDGGWAGIDKKLAAEISKQGVPVIGLDSLRYFWKARTPQAPPQMWNAFCSTT